MALSVAFLVLSVIGMVLFAMFPAGQRGPFWVCAAVFTACLAHLVAVSAFLRRIRLQGWHVPAATFAFRYELIPGGRSARIPPKADCESLPSFDSMRDDMANLCDVLETMHSATRDFVEVRRDARHDMARLAKFVLQSEECRPVALEKVVPGPCFVVRVPKENLGRAQEILARRMPPVDLPQA